MSVPTAIVGHKLRSLDGLRAIAIILVFLHHMKGQMPVVNWFTFYLTEYLHQGWMGVDLFFVLSGFLITGILLDTREASNYFTGFYARRVLRIFPLYYVVLTTVIIAGCLLNSPDVTATLPLPKDRWLYYCYMTNWLGLWKAHLGPGYANYLAHFWSLAVEEQFYLTWPLIVWVIRPRMLPWVAGTLAVLAALTRLAWVAHSGAQMAIAWATSSRVDELLTGALCAYLFRDPELMLRIRKWLPWIATLGLGTFFLIFSAMLFFPSETGLLLYGTSPVRHTLDDAGLLFTECGGYVLLSVGFGALVLLAAYTEGEKTWLQKFLSFRLLSPVGAYSYGIYVFHVPILGAAAMFVFPKIMRSAHSEAEAVMSECAYIVVVAVVIFVISAISYECFEKKILRFKRFFEPRYTSVSQDPVLDDLVVSPQTTGP